MVAQPLNDQCDSAIVLTNLDEWCYDTTQFPFDATASLPSNTSCVPDDVALMKDIWFTFQTRGSYGSVVQNLAASDGLFSSELYKGSCDELEPLDCSYDRGIFASDRFDSLQAGEQLFYRMSIHMDSSKLFQICINSPIEVEGSCDGIEIFTSNDTTIDYGSAVRLSATHLPIDSSVTYEWYDGPNLICSDCSEVEVTPFTTTDYTVSITDPDLCVTRKTVTITVKIREEDRVVYIPNAFSPNGDNINDQFTVYGSSFVRSIVQLDIYDRWGNLVFRRYDAEPDNAVMGWDGTYHGKKAGIDTYVYSTKVQFIDGSTRDFNGSVNLLR